MQPLTPWIGFIKEMPQNTFNHSNYDISIKAVEKNKTVIAIVWAPIAFKSSIYKHGL